jgi:uncharacterized protein YndB with AHSA1/START domain
VKRALHFDAFYPHPPERVWTALTNRDSIARWLMENDFEPRLGHRFQLRAKPVPGWDGIVNCEVLELDPPTRMSWSWKSSAPLDTVVTFELHAEGMGTRLHLAHTGFAGMKQMMISFILGGGWKKMLRESLRAAIESEPFEQVRH